MISHAHKCIFIHIPKTAGTSIEKKLGHFEKLHPGAQDHRTIRDIEPINLKYLARLHKKENIYFFLRRTKNRLLENRPIVKSSQYSSYYKFTIVRNPWSRIFSWYRNMMRHESKRRTFGISDDCSLSQFLERHMDLMGMHSQLHWIADSKGNIPLDFIGRFEKLNKDFSHVCNVLGLEDNTLPTLIKGDNLDYREFYDDRSRKIVASAYKEEISILGYDFDN